MKLHLSVFLFMVLLPLSDACVMNPLRQVLKKHNELIISISTTDRRGIFRIWLRQGTGPDDVSCHFRHASLKFKMFIYRMLERNVKMTADKIKTYIAINANFLKSSVVT